MYGTFAAHVFNSLPLPGQVTGNTSKRGATFYCHPERCTWLFLLLGIVVSTCQNGV